MSKELSESSPEVKQMFSKASDILGYDLLEIVISLLSSFFFLLSLCHLSNFLSSSLYSAPMVQRQS